MSAHAVAFSDQLKIACFLVNFVSEFG